MIFFSCPRILLIIFFLMDTAILTLPMIPRQEIIECTVNTYLPQINITRGERPIFEYLKDVADDLRDLGFPIEQIENLPSI